MRTSTLYLSVASVSVAIVLTACIAGADDRESTEALIRWVNVIGASMTFGGLAYAALRSNSLLPQKFRDLVRRLRGVGIPAAVYVENAMGATAAMPGVTVTVDQDFAAADRKLDPVERLSDRTDALLLFAKNLQTSLVSAERKIADMSKAHADAQAAARAELQRGDEHVSARAAEALRQHVDEVKRGARLDLRWAIAGTFFQTVGACLAFWYA